MAADPLNRAAFAAIVAQSLDDLPEVFRAATDNVETVVEDWPDAETMQRAGVGHPAQLLGYYHGVPLTRRDHNYTMVLPDKISIYRMPIVMRCRTRDQVREMVGRVVRHEVAHHFGIDDERLREIETH
jgi:predicted Zn-dependent protease with MMP-like domain